MSEGADAHNDRSTHLDCLDAQQVSPFGHFVVKTKNDPTKYNGYILGVHFVLVTVADYPVQMLEKSFQNRLMNKREPAYLGAEQNEIVGLMLSYQRR